LARFPNPDGGCGPGLEPARRTPASSALATTVARQHLRALDADEDDPLVQGAMGYLVDTYDPALQAWPIIPATANDAPHAPWWLYDEDLAQRWRGFKANPRAEIVGYLVDYPGLAPASLREQLTQAVVDHLEAPPEPLEMHDLFCYVRLAETRSLPEDTRARILRSLWPLVDQAVARDPADWAGYGLQPLAVVASPGSPLAGQLADAVQANLDWQIQQQGEDGAWAPNWSWGGDYPKAWERAQREWKGVLTVKALRQLQLFGRVD
jgi:hypothetical protein